MTYIEKINYFKEQIAKLTRSTNGRPQFPKELRLEIIDFMQDQGFRKVCLELGISPSTAYGWMAQKNRKLDNKKIMPSVRKIRVVQNSAPNPSSSTSALKIHMNGITLEGDCYSLNCDWLVQLKVLLNQSFSV